MLIQVTQITEDILSGGRVEISPSPGPRELMGPGNRPHSEGRQLPL